MESASTQTRGENGSEQYVNRSSMHPRFLTVRERIQETGDVVSLTLDVPDEHADLAQFRPGQFNMLYAFGVGEVPISISGDPSRPDSLTHTVRDVGPVSGAIARLQEGDALGVRGPFGNTWPVEEAVGYDVLIIAGGIGLMPLRPVIYSLLAQRERYGNVAILYGAKEQADILFRAELDQWQNTPGLHVAMSLNQAERDWKGAVGYVTQLLPGIQIDPLSAYAVVCGPEIMIRNTAHAVKDLGVPGNRIFSSLERNMKCAVGTCGHCQLGPLFLCRDGPIFDFNFVGPLMTQREL